MKPHLIPSGNGDHHGTHEEYIRHLEAAAARWEALGQALQAANVRSNLGTVRDPSNCAVCRRAAERAKEAE